MMSYATIADLGRQAARKAKRNHIRPLAARETLAALEGQSQAKIPFLGDYVPEGLVQDENVEPYFVDSTGRGTEDELAITQVAFKEIVRRWVVSGEPVSFGVIEAGECQVVIAVYRPDPRDFTHTGKLTRDDLNHVRKG